MQDVSNLALEQSRAERAVDLVDFVRFSNRGKRQYLPVFLLDDMTDEVILVQPLHELSRVRRVWSYHSLTAFRRDSESASSGFSGSSIMIMSAPRPVSTPPTDVAMCVPCSVVAKSWTAWRSASRTGKSRRYHALVIIRRQSRANLSAKS